MRKAKAISLKLWVWPVPVEKPFIGNGEQAADRAADRAPGSPTRSRTTIRIERREKPSARSVPISRVRDATIAYMVFIAPNTAPMPITKATKLREHPQDACDSGPACSS